DVPGRCRLDNESRSPVVEISEVGQLGGVKLIRRGDGAFDAVLKQLIESIHNDCPRALCERPVKPVSYRIGLENTRGRAPHRTLQIAATETHSPGRCAVTRRLMVLCGSLVWLNLSGAARADVPLYSGLGTLHHAVTTRSPAAQRYFDQGLKLCYAFNHDEAIRAFREAVRLDPSCAMGHWGIAYALGPNVNLPVDPDREREAFAEVQKARQRGAAATARERAYIDALARRYSDDPKADLHALDVAFADAMRGLSVKYPDDLDAAVIFAEALLDVRPWDWWSRDGKPQPGTLEAVQALTRVLRKSPSHIGANHLFIHAIEESPNPARALPAASRLARLAPNAGHLMHMPSHVYMLVGRYHEAAELNRKAIGVDLAYIEKEKPQGVYPHMYLSHNMHMGWAAMSFEGRSKEAIRMARTLASHVS